MYHRALTNWRNICPSTTWQRSMPLHRSRLVVPLSCFPGFGCCSKVHESWEYRYITKKNRFKRNCAKFMDVSHVECLRCNTENPFLTCCDHGYPSIFQLTNYLASISLLWTSVNMIIYSKFLPSLKPTVKAAKNTPLAQKGEDCLSPFPTIFPGFFAISFRERRSTNHVIISFQSHQSPGDTAPPHHRHLVTVQTTKQPPPPLRAGKWLSFFKWSGQIIIFHQPSFPEIRGFPLLNHHLGEIGCVRSL